MKICMVGDSHLTMILEAHKQLNAASIEVDAVTWPRQHEDQFSFEGVELVATGNELAKFWEVGGLPDRIDVTQYDKVVFVSYTITMFNIFKILSDHVVSSWNGAEHIIDSINACSTFVSKRRLLTASALQESMVGIIRSNYAFRIASALRDYSSMPISVVPPPFLREETLTYRPNLTGLKRILNNNDGVSLADAFNSAHRSAFADIADVCIITQPEHTLTRGCLTKESYRSGAKKFGTDIAHKADDVMHAGPLLGQVIWNELLKVHAGD